MPIPVVISANGRGLPVRPVEKNAPTMIVATNGKGAPIVISDLGAPFIVQGYNDIEQFALSSDDGANLTDDDTEVMETYNGNSSA